MRRDGRRRCVPARRWLVVCLKKVPCFFSCSLSTGPAVRATLSGPNHAIPDPSAGGFWVAGSDCGPRACGNDEVSRTCSFIPPPLPLPPRYKQPGDSARATASAVWQHGLARRLRRLQLIRHRLQPHWPLSGPTRLCMAWHRHQPQFHLCNPSGVWVLEPEGVFMWKCLPVPSRSIPRWHPTARRLLFARPLSAL